MGSHQTLPRRLIAAYDDKQLYCLQTTNVINLKESAPKSLELKYLLGLLNSNLLNWFFRISFPSNNHIASNQLAQLPIRTIDFSDSKDVARHEKMVMLVQQMLDLQEQLAAARISQEKTIIQHRINATDRQIDQLVYDLYELTNEEVKIVEDATGH